MLGDLRHFGDLLTRNARVTGNLPGLADARLRLTWKETEARTNQLSHALQRLGLHQGERVGILSGNGVPFVESLFALARLGLVAVPVNTMLQPAEVAQQLRDCEAVALLADSANLEKARDAASQVSTLRVMVQLDGDPASRPGDIAHYETLLAKESESLARSERPIAAEDLLILLYTSGTTGLPKGVMYSHRGALLGTLIHVLAIGSHRRHRVMLPSPPYSAAGFAGIACAVAVGCSCHLLRFRIEDALHTLARESITFTNLVPTTLRMLLEHPQRGDHDLRALEILLYGGSPMPESTLRLASEHLGCGFRQTFATSETGLAGTVLEPEDHLQALQDPAAAHLLSSCGKPQVGVGVRIVDDDWQELPRGELGEIAVACDANMQGYWKRPEATSKVLKDGWLRTGDLARQDDAGFFYLVDRKHDMIVTGALNVYPSEVEKVLRELPEVADCAVVGLPHPKWGEAVTAFVVAAPGETVAKDAILDHTRQQLAGHKRPKAIHIVDSIPRNPAGKPLRRRLRESHAS